MVHEQPMLLDFILREVHAVYEGHVVHQYLLLSEELIDQHVAQVPCPRLQKDRDRNVWQGWCPQLQQALRIVRLVNFELHPQLKQT